MTLEALTSARFPPVARTKRRTVASSSADDHCCSTRDRTCATCAEGLLKDRILTTFTGVAEHPRWLLEHEQELRSSWRQVE